MGPRAGLDWWKRMCVKDIKGGKWVFLYFVPPWLDDDLPSRNMLRSTVKNGHCAYNKNRCV